MSVDLATRRRALVASLDFRRCPRRGARHQRLGSWCGPCIEELPDLEQSYEATVGEGEPVVSIGVNRRDGVATALAFQKPER
ncbi:MAG: hypothetical protein WBG36_15875 [Ornithinimicrobium sp.]